MKPEDKEFTGKETPDLHNSDHGSIQHTNSPNENPYDSENLDNETGSELKDITEQDIENDLRNSDYSEDFAIVNTEIDHNDSDELNNDKFDIHEVDETAIHNKEFEIGQLSNEEIKNDELNNDEIDSGQFDNDELNTNS